MPGTSHCAQTRVKGADTPRPLRLAFPTRRRSRGASSAARRAPGELRPARQRDHERRVDPGRVDGEELLEQVWVVVAIRFEGDARGVVVAYPSRERERRQVELSRAAAG